MIRALLFDFDGLLYDSESAAFGVWRDLYADHGAEFPLALWQSEVMGRPPGSSSFEPLAHLEAIAAPGLDPVATLETLERRREAQFPHELLPGAIELLHRARAAGLALAIVSSNSTERILGHLARAGVPPDFDEIVTADGDPARGKPNPALYLEALDRLGLTADEAVVFEDSPNGILAARRAGIRVVAVPNALTAGVPGVELADETLGSLAQYALPSPG